MQFAVKELLKYKMHKEDKYISTITCLICPSWYHLRYARDGKMLEDENGFDIDG